MIDLQQFCGTDEMRPYLHKPFSAGDYTYATNGHIMVRVARLAEVGEIEKLWDRDAPLKSHNDAKFRRVNDLVLPKVVPPEEGDCPDCDGRGCEHDCPDCECVCEMCNGTGVEIAEAEISTTLSGLIFNLRYVRMIASLPRLEIATNPEPERPLAFRFDGGIGELMPMRRQYSEHVEVERGELVTP